MNHCRDCNSDYEKPGSCNCFAVGGKRSTAPGPGWYPSPWIQPYVIPYYPQTYPYWYGNSAITGGDIPKGSPFITTTASTTFTMDTPEPQS